MYYQKIDPSMVTHIETGKINENTFLIDANMLGLKGLLSLYVIKARRTALIDAGESAEEARVVIKTLKELELFPIDEIIITHSHYDHCFGVPQLLKEMPDAKVYASHLAIPNLSDPSKINSDFSAIAGEGTPIADVIPLKEGDVVDLDGVTLKVFELPGHTPDHIGLLDENNKNLFVGDAIGNKFDENTFFPPFMPPLFSEKNFLESIEKLKKLIMKVFHLVILDALKVQTQRQY